MADSCFNAKWKSIEEFCSKLGKLGSITDKSNAAEAMALLALAWGLGMTMAPAFGGWLSDPAAQYP